jgi:beta-lactamase superfamily II metal-dependent hydrolase
MTKPTPLKDAEFVDEGGFLDSLTPADLVYFLLSVGDADAQVVLLPDWSGNRRVLVIDAGQRGKVPDLLEALKVAGLIDLTPFDQGNDSFPIALVVATHPHDDHIGGLAQLFDQYRGLIAEFWEPGYIHTADAYLRMMTAVELHPRMLYAQPTSGMQRWIGQTGLTVLSPSINLRNRYDTYGVDINDSSISIRIEHPAARVQQSDGQRNYQPNKSAATLVLGADAQTLSWSFALTDFPVLQPSLSETAKRLDAARGDWNLLSGSVLKISHHASKHGVNLELVERIQPKLTLVSCSSNNRGRHGFPHDVAQDVIREALQPIAGGSGRKQRHSDAQLGLLYTGDTLDTGGLAGSIAVVMRGTRRHTWRFFDDTSEPVTFANGRRWNQPAT